MIEIANSSDKERIKELFSLLKRSSSEIITEYELLSLLKNGEAVAYIGYEPSNVLHLGSLVACRPLLTLLKFGFKGKILLADIHAWLNGKGELDELRIIGKNNEDILKRLCKLFEVDPDLVEFVYGSDYQFDREYVELVLKLSKLVTASEARKAMDLISKREVAPKISSEIYALMQCIDIMYLNVNVAIGGIDQRKIHVMAREFLKKLGYEKPVAIHTPIILGLNGTSKMSKSLDNAITFNDDDETIAHKIKMAFCPEGKVEGNPLFDIIEYVIFPWKGEFEVGANYYKNVEELKISWEKREITALELKNAVTNVLVEIFKKIR
ncbi:MAG: tyrosine--tRNA ligase [Candidatus Aenigmarchaeota archaeon]|nr:tyrosine--tRNA ligase [Candidatus Aenigmarchaeota archaeon]